MTADNLFDARDRFPGPDVPIAIPMDPHDIVDLARLRLLEQNLNTPILNLLHVVANAEFLADKAANHEALGYGHIKVGAIDALREAVRQMRETRGQL